MKHALHLGLLAALFIGAGALAADEADAHKTGPCRILHAACMAGGFQPGHHKQEGRGLWKDCMQPILEGKVVAGVTTNANDVAACKAKRAEREAKK